MKTAPIAVQVAEVVRQHRIEQGITGNPDQVGVVAEYAPRISDAASQTKTGHRGPRKLVEAPQECTVAVHARNILADDGRIYVILDRRYEMGTAGNDVEIVVNAG